MCSGVSTHTRVKRRERGREKTKVSAAVIVYLWACVCDCMHRFVGARVSAEYFCDESTCCQVESRPSCWCAFPISPHSDPQGNPSSGQVHYPAKYMAQALGEWTSWPGHLCSSPACLSQCYRGKDRHRATLGSLLHPVKNRRKKCGLSHPRPGAPCDYVGPHIYDFSAGALCVLICVMGRGFLPGC